MFKRVLLCYDGTEVGRIAWLRARGAGSQRVSLAERANCCIFVAVNSADTPGDVPK